LEHALPPAKRILLSGVGVCCSHFSSLTDFSLQGVPKVIHTPLEM
jgi:hypothetical protein